MKREYFDAGNTTETFDWAAKLEFNFIRHSILSIMLTVLFIWKRNETKSYRMLTSCVSLCSLLELNTSIFHQTIFTTYYPTVVTMGNTNGGGGGGFRQETIKSASYHTRSLNSSGSSNSGPGSHHGVVVNTNQGNFDDRLYGRINYRNYSADT